MKTINYIMIFTSVFSIMLSCGSSYYSPKEGVKVVCKVVNIEEYEFAYTIDAVTEETDTVLIISLKEFFFEKYNLKKPTNLDGAKRIIENESYNFIMSSIKPQVSSMEQLGAFIIIEKDTLLSAKTYKDIPKSYTSQNSIGLNVFE